MLTKFTRRFIAALLGLFVATTHAEIVVFEFHGKLTYDAYTGTVGTPVVGQFAWDADTLEAPPITSNFNAAEYSHPATVGVWAKVGAHTIVSTNLRVMVYDDTTGSGQDLIDIVGYAPVLDGTTYRDGALFMRMVTAPGDRSVFSSLALPSKLNVQAFRWEYYGGMQSDGGPTGQIFQFSIDSIRRVQSLRGLLPRAP